MSSIETHPKFQEIEGFSDTQATNHYQALQVYIDLAECKNWWNLEVKPCPAVGLLFISGQETQFEAESFVLAVPSDGEMSMSDLDVHKKTVREHFNSNTLVLGIVDGDSAVVYYRVSEGLVPPERPEQMEAKRLKSQRYRERRKQRRIRYTNIAEAVSIKKGLLHQSSQESPQKTSSLEASESVTSCSQASSRLSEKPMSSFERTKPKDILSTGDVEMSTNGKVSHTASERGSSLFDDSDDMTIGTYGSQNKSSFVDSDTKISVDSDVTIVEWHRRGNRRNVTEKDSENAKHSCVSDYNKDAYSLLTMEKSQSNEVHVVSSTTGSDPCTSEQRSPQARAPMEGEGHSEDLESSLIDMEDNEDQMMEDAMDRRLPNMAPEDFEDVEYPEEFEGEL